jgi:hypothetical protein
LSVASGGAETVEHAVSCAVGVELEDSALAAGPARLGGSIQCAIAGLHQSGPRVLSIAAGGAEAMEHPITRSVRVKLKDRPFAAGSTVGRSLVQRSIAGLQHAAIRVLAVAAARAEAVEDCVPRPIGVESEDGAGAVGPSMGGCPIQRAIRTLHERTGRTKAVAPAGTETVKDSVISTIGTQFEHAAAAGAAPSPSRAIKCAVIASQQSRARTVTVAAGGIETEEHAVGAAIRIELKDRAVAAAPATIGGTI